MLDDELKQLIDRSMQANLQLLSRAGGVLKEASQAMRDPQLLRGKDVRTLLGSLVQLELDYLKRLSEANMHYLGAVVSLAESAVSPREAPPDTAAGQATALTGRVGETLAFQFQLDNPNDQAVSAAIEARDWQSREGDLASADSFVFEPAATVVSPGTVRVIQGRITVDGRFVPGRTYDTVIRVAGFPGRQMALSLTVSEAGA